MRKLSKKRRPSSSGAATTLSMPLPPSTAASQQSRVPSSLPGNYPYMPSPEPTALPPITVVKTNGQHFASTPYTATPSQYSIDQQLSQQTPVPRDSGEPRRSSFSFLRRSKSQQSVGGRRVASGGSDKMSRKQKARQREEELRRQREAAAVPKQPPRLPQHSPLPIINSFGGEDARPDSVAIVSNRASGQTPTNFGSRTGTYGSSTPYKNPPIPPMPGSEGPAPGLQNGSHVDPYARTESMTHRSRYSYASSAAGTFNSPRRVRRRKDPTPFNILVIGARNSGKTSFINFLRTALLTSAKKRPQTPSSARPENSPSSTFTAHYLETEIDHERIGVTLWDSQGLEKNIVDLQLREMSSFLESKFEETFTEEQKVVRAPGVRDTHIHCVFLILDPARLDATVSAARQSQDGTPSRLAKAPTKVHGGLDDQLDMQTLRALQGKTIVIPVISKADTITTSHMSYLKRTVWDSLKQAKLDPLEALELADEDSEAGGSLDEREEEDEVVKNTSSNGPDAVNDSSANETSTFYDSDTNGDHTSSSIPTSPPPPVPDNGSPGDPTLAKSSAGRKDHRRSNSSMSASLTLNATGGNELPPLPLSILSPDMYDTSSGPPGRRFPWGFADPYDATHCDFVRLKESVFSEWRGELREAAREKWYEGWRTSRLKKRSAMSFQSPNRQRRVSAGTDAARPPPPQMQNMSPNRAVNENEIGVASTAPVPIQAPRSMENSPVPGRYTETGRGTPRGQPQYATVR